MNLNLAIGNIIAAVNPQVCVSVQLSNGSTEGADGTLMPTYDTPVEVLAQVQPLAASDLHHMDMLGQQGTHRAIYINGPIRGAVRSSLRGGDRITLPDCSVWLVTQPTENWFETAGWTEAVITLQNNS